MPAAHQGRVVDHWNHGDFDDTHRASGFGGAMALATVARWPGGAVEDASDLAEPLVELLTRESVAEGDTRCGILMPLSGLDACWRVRAPDGIAGAPNERWTSVGFRRADIGEG